MHDMKAEFWEQTFADLVERWKKCEKSNGKYFEGTHIQVEPEDFGDSDSESSEDSQDD